MRLMRYAPTNWLDVMAMRVEGAVSSWVNAVLQDISEGRKPVIIRVVNLCTCTNEPAGEDLCARSVIEQ